VGVVTPPPRALLPASQRPRLQGSPKAGITHGRAAAGLRRGGLNCIRTSVTKEGVFPVELNGDLPLGLLDKLGRWREQRRHPRHGIISTAWIRIADDPVPHVCVLWDISEGGARLSVTDMARVPNEFLLVLERDAPRGTSCRVAWRRQDQIGLEFIDHADWKLHDLIRHKAAAPA
jgi:hypothetical protein